MTTLSPIQCSNLAAHNDQISHGFFTRTGGLSEGIYEGLNVGFGSQDNNNTVRKNRTLVADNLGSGMGDIITPWQIHSNNSIVVNQKWDGNRPKGDAVICATANLPIAIVTADCGPVLFCDPAAGIIAATHAGWRGATGGILESTIEAMIDLGAKKTDIIATLGPTIAQKNYEVGPQFIDDLLAMDKTNDAYLSPSPNPGRAQFNLPKYIVNRLNAYNVNATWTGHCTYENETEFYSYRRMTHRSEPDYGRQVSAIMIKG